MTSTPSISTPADNTRLASPSLSASTVRRKVAKSWPILDDCALYRADTRIFLESRYDKQDLCQPLDLSALGKDLPMLKEFGKASNLSYRRPLERSFWRRPLAHSGTDKGHTDTPTIGENRGFGSDLEKDSMSLHDLIVRVVDEHVRKTEDRWKGLGHDVPQSSGRLTAIESQIRNLPQEVHDQIRRELPCVNKGVLALIGAEWRARMYRMYLKCFLCWRNADIRRWFEHGDEDGVQHTTGPAAA